MTVDLEKIIEAAKLCSAAAVRGDDLAAFAYAEAIIRIARTEVPTVCDDRRQAFGIGRRPPTDPPPPPRR